MNKSSSNYPFEKNDNHKKYNTDNNNIKKTTNINVLLNRVKLDQKNFNKNYYFL